jgi:hypothetical protein
MKKYILLFLTTLLSVISALSQNLNKNPEHLKKLSLDNSNHIYANFLYDEFGYKQEIGLGSNIIAYNEYKNKYKTNKSDGIILKNQPYFKSVRYVGDSNDILSTIRFEFDSKNYKSIKDKLTGLFGEPDADSYGHLGQLIYFIPNQFYIILSTYNFLEISAIDFLENKSKYDEFSKTGMTYFNYTPIRRIGSSVYIMQYFAYYYNKENNDKGFAIKTEYTGDEWLYMNKLEYLLEDGSVLKIEMEPKRKVDRFLNVVSCNENDISIVSDEFIAKLIASKTIKVKVSGKNNYIIFELTPLHKYQILTAIHYCANNLY